MDDALPHMTALQCLNMAMTSHQPLYTPLTLMQQSCSKSDLHEGCHVQFLLKVL